MQNPTLCVGRFRGFLRFARTTKAFVSAGRWRPTARLCRIPVQARSAPSPAPAMPCIAAEPKDTKTPLCGDTKTARLAAPTQKSQKGRDSARPQSTFRVFCVGPQARFRVAGRGMRSIRAGALPEGGKLAWQPPRKDSAESQRLSRPAFSWPRVSASLPQSPIGDEICLPPH